MAGGLGEVSDRSARLHRPLKVYGRIYKSAWGAINTTINDSLGALPRTQLAQFLPATVPDAVTCERPPAS